MSNLPNLNSLRKDSTEKSFYSIVEFSEITKLAKNTLRSLEKEFGLEVLRDAKGNRVYTSSDIERFLYAFNLRGNVHNLNLNPNLHNTSSNQSLNEEFSLLPSSKPLQQISEITEQREVKIPKFLKLLKTLSNPFKNLNLASLLSFPIIVSTFLSVFAFSSLNDFLDAPRNLELFPSNTKSQNTASVLQSTSDIYEYRFDVNIPAYFNSTVNISDDLITQGNITSTGNAIFNTASFQNVSVGEVSITPTGISAPNIVNSLNLEDGEDNLVLDNDDPNNPVLSLNTNLNLSELTVDTLNSSTLNGITEIDAESAQTIQQAINFSTDAETLNGLSSDNFLRSNTSTTYSGGVFGLSSGASFEALSGSSLTIKQGSLFEVSSGATFKFSNVPANSYLKVDSTGNLSYFNITAGDNITVTTSPNSVVITGVDPSILDSLAVGTLFFGPSHEEQYRLLPSLSELNKLYTLAGSILSSSNITSFYPNLDTDATNDLIISTLASSNVYSINTWYGFQDFTRISAFNTEIEQNGSIKFTSGAVPTSYSGRLYYSSNRMFFEELPIAMYYDSTYDHLGKLAQFETDASGRLLLRGTSELSIDLFESGAPNQILGAVPLGGGGTSTEYVSIGGDLSMSISGTLASYTLNTVNTNPGTFGGEYYIPIVTVDGKGRVTAVTTTPNANVFPNYITNISFSTPSPAHRTFILERAGFSDAYATFSLAPVDITTALNYTPLNKSGDTMSGSLLVQGSITSTQTISSSSLISSFGSITNLSSSTLTLTNPLSVIYGGTGKTETPANGQLLIGDSGGYTLSTLTGGTNVSVNSSAGYISISSIDTYITGLSFSDSAPNRKLLTITRNNLTPLSNVFSLSASDITTALNYTPLNKSGDTMSGSLLVQSSINATQNITSNTTISAPTLIQNGNGVCDLSGNCLAATQTIVGSGSAGYIPRFLGTYSIADSTLFQDSYSNIGIGGTNPGEKLDVFGAIRLSTDMGTGPRTLALYQDQGNLYWNGQAVGVIGGTGPGGIIGQVGYFPFFNTTTSLVNSDFQYISNVNERGLELITPNDIPVYLGIGRSGNETFKMGVASDNSNFFGAGETAEDVVLINESTNASSDLVFSNIGVQSRFLFKFGPNPNPSEIVSMKYSQASTNSRLGINTTDPRSELEVVGSALITDTLAVATFSNPSSTQAFTFLSGGNFNGNLSASNATLNVISGVSLTLSGNAIISGNLGLGNTNPTSRLDMTGNLNLENTSSSTTGVITKNGVSFISNFAHPTGGSATPDGFNTFIGLQSGNFTTGSSASQTSEASRNTALGYQTLKDITTAYENTALGAFALRDLINGYQNTAIGSNTLMLSTTAYQNTVLGANALSGLTTGHQNIAIGYSAGRYLSNGSTLNNHSENSIYIGLNTKSKQAASTNEIVIGNSQTGLGDNSIILGNSSNLITALTGNVGLGTTNPSEKLEVVGTIKGDSLNILGTGAINTLTLTNALSPIYGGTGITQTPASGQILIGNASGGYSLETLLEGTNVDISIASSSVTISSEDRYLTNANFTDSAPNIKVLTLTQVDKTGNTIPAISANFSLSSSDITTALNYTPTNKSGDTMSGPLLVQGNITSTQTMSSSTAIFTRTQTNTFFLKDVSQSNTLQLEANVGSTNRKLILDLNQGTLDNTTLSLKGMQSVNFQSSSNDKNLTFNFIAPDQNRTFDVLNQGTLPAINANILDIYNATLSASTFSSPSSNTFNFLNGTVIATTFSGSASGLTSLNAGNLTGTIPSSVLAGSSLFIGTTEIPLNRTSGAQALTGITGISSTTSLSLTAGGSNQNITLTPSGTGYTLLNGNVGLSFTLPQNLLTVGSYNSATFSNLKQGLLSVDNTLLAQLEGGAYFGRVGITENQWGVSNAGNTWIQRNNSSNSWRGNAMSSDGRIQTAVPFNNGQIHTSTDYGVTWTARDSSRFWRSVAMSSDGKVQTAVVQGGLIYTSSDYGVTWTARGSSRNWWSVAMSSDGKVQTAVAETSNIYTSYDYGVSWTARDSVRQWSDVAMSSDGKIQTSVTGGNNIYTSYDYGVTWTARESSRRWISIAMSSDGKVQTAVAETSNIYTSYDYGVSWTARDSVREWSDVAMSSDGRIQTATIGLGLVASGNIYISSDSGSTWSAKGTVDYWQSVAMSSDGKIQTAVTLGGIFTSYADSYVQGSIGIGTTSPGSLLDVQGNMEVGATNFPVRETGFGYDSISYKVLQLGYSDTTFRSVALNIDPSSIVGGNFSGRGQILIPKDRSILAPNNAGSDWGGVLRYTNDSLYLGGALLGGELSGNALVVKSDGKVGIGTTNPGAKLEVNSTGIGIDRSYGAIKVNVSPGTYSNGASTGTALGLFSNTSYDNQGATAQLGLIQQTSNANDIDAGVYLSIKGWHQNSATSLPIAIGGGYIGITPSIFIAGAGAYGGGNVGIGTTNPSQKLQINSSGNPRSDSGSSSIRIDNTVSGRFGILGVDDNQNLILWNSTSSPSSGNGGILFLGGSGSGTERMRIDSSGRVGIGTTNPNELLEIYTNATDTDVLRLRKGFGVGGMQFELNGYLSDIQTFENVSPNGYMRFRVATNSSGGKIEAMRLLNNGNVGIGTVSPSYRLELPNVANTTGQGRANAWVTYSDQSLKENISPIIGSLDKILGLRGVSFEWKDLGIASSGFIAQEVENIIPDLVSTGSDGIKSLDYGRVTPYLVNAIQEQQLQIQTLSDSSLNLSNISSSLASSTQNLSLAMSSITLTQASQELNLSTMNTSFSNALSTLTTNQELFSLSLNSLNTSQEGFSLSLNTLSLKQEELSNAVGSLNLQSFQDLVDSVQETLDALTMDTLNGELVISSDLLVSGDSIFNNATFTGDVSIGQMSFNTLDNSLNVLGASCVNLDGTLDNTLCDTQTLYVMKNKAGNINFFDGKITFKPNGDLEVEKIRTKVLEITEFSAPTPTDTCNKGQVKFGEESGVSYIYVCIDNNSWKRSELTSY